MAKEDRRRHDHVTGLPARVECIRHVSGESLKSGESPRCLILVTLAEATHFNRLLRALGQGFAEDFIRAGAERFSQVHLITGPVFHVSVLSFAFLLRLEEEAESAAEPKVVTALKRAFAEPILVDDIPLKAQVGIGLIALDDPERDPAESLRGALTAAQDSRGRLAGWAWYDHKSDAAHQRAFRLLTDLAPAIEGEGLELHYQPRIDLKTMRCSSAEALLRWTHPELGWISPGEFIPLAETTALIEPLTNWVLASAIEQLRLWSEAGLDLKVSVNVSTRNLADPGFAQRLFALLDRAGVPPRRLEIEMTESAFLEHGQLVQAEIAKVRAAGIDVAIDDFGSGYSNLSYLTKLNAGVLKIDQSFVRGLDDEGNRFLIDRIVSIGKGLGYRVVAEGVETVETLQFLHQQGCDEAQGYLFAKPLAVPAFRDWLTDWQASRNLEPGAGLTRVG
jgi:EAL domain-containing protein (putative c-di-GMP-specific phosphodiesterase class I)